MTPSCWFDLGGALGSTEEGPELFAGSPLATANCDCEVARPAERERRIILYLLLLEREEKPVKEKNGFHLLTTSLDRFMLKIIFISSTDETVP